MGSMDLVYICTSAFAAVFFLLMVLAIVMRVIIVVFPQREAEADAVVLAAVATVAASIYPGTKITKVEEIK